MQARIITVSGGFYTLKLADGGGIKLRESRLYTTEEDAKKEANAPITKTIIWNLVFIVIATATIITVNTIQNKKVLTAIESVKNKESKKTK